MELNQQLGEPMNIEEYIPHSDYNNYPKKTKSSVFSPENNDEYNGNVIKRIKKEYCSTEAIRSSESNVQQTLKLVIPTANTLAVPIPKTHQSVSTKNNDDIENPIFKLPFEHGWRRELIYTTPGVYHGIRMSNTCCGVNYFTPTNQMLQSLHEIQEYLDSPSNVNNYPLTIDCFTFLKQSIGINSDSKELIKEAVSQSIKGNTRPKRAKTQSKNVSNNEPPNNMQNINKISRPAIAKEISQNTLSIGEMKNNSSDYAIFKLPFEHGWKREVVFRSSGVTSKKKQCKSFCDVYYFTPANRKLRSLREIQKHLNSLVFDNNPLTIDNFTFMRQAIGINDQSKELIRNAIHLSKNNSKLKMGKTHSINVPNELPNNMDKKKKILHSTISNKEKKGKDSKKPATKSQLVIQSSTTSSASTSQTDDNIKNITNNNKRNPVINDSLRKKSNPMVNMQSYNYMTIGLRNVFKFLKINELLTASRVCTAWNIIAKNDTLWQNICLKNSKINDWEKCMYAIDVKCSISMDTRYMFIPQEINENKNFWLCFANAIQKAKKLKTIELYRCPTYVVEDTIKSLPQLEKLIATIENPNSNDTNSVKSITLNLGYLEQMTQLTEFRIKELNTEIKLLSIPSFSKLTNLNILSLTSIKSFPEEIYSSLLTLAKSLKVLEIGNCDSLSKKFPSVLEKLVELTSLRLENCNGKWNNYGKQYLHAIKGLQNLETLELINIKFSHSIECDLDKCNHIKALLIIPDYKNQSSAINFHLLYRLKKLSNTLRHLVWGITNESLYDNDVFNHYIQNMYDIRYNLKLSTTNEASGIIPIPKLRIPISQSIKSKIVKNDTPDDFNTLKVRAFEELLKTVFKSAKTKVVKTSFSEITGVYLVDQFNEIKNNIKTY